MKTSNRILLCIFSYCQERAYSPTIREIGDFVGLSSTASVSRHLDKLNDRKLITMLEKKPRTIRVTAKGNKVVHELLNQQIKEQQGNAV